MSDTVISCPICKAECQVKNSKTGQPGFYCKCCKVQVRASGGKSREFIIVNSRPAQSEAVKSEEVKDVTVEQPKGDTGEQRKSDGGFLSRFFSGGDED